jgi:hypothetical protein
VDRTGRWNRKERVKVRPNYGGAEETDVKTAFKDERLLGAAKTDNVELILEVFEEGGFDINHQDGFVMPISLRPPSINDDTSQSREHRYEAIMRLLVMLKTILSTALHYA